MFLGNRFALLLSGTVLLGACSSAQSRLGGCTQANVVDSAAVNAEKAKLEASGDLEFNPIGGYFVVNATSANLDISSLKARSCGAIVFPTKETNTVLVLTSRHCYYPGRTISAFISLFEKDSYRQVPLELGILEAVKGTKKQLEGVDGALSKALLQSYGDFDIGTTYGAAKCQLARMEKRIPADKITSLLCFTPHDLQVFKAQVNDAPKAFGFTKASKGNSSPEQIASQRKLAQFLEAQQEIARRQLKVIAAKQIAHLYPCLVNDLQKCRDTEPRVSSNADLPSLLDRATRRFSFVTLEHDDTNFDTWAIEGVDPKKLDAKLWAALQAKLKNEDTLLDIVDKEKAAIEKLRRTKIWPLFTDPSLANEEFLAHANYRTDGGSKRAFGTLPLFVTPASAAHTQAGQPGVMISEKNMVIFFSGLEGIETFEKSDSGSALSLNGLPIGSLSMVGSEPVESVLFEPVVPSTGTASANSAPANPVLTAPVNRPAQTASMPATNTSGNPASSNTTAANTTAAPANPNRAIRFEPIVLARPKASTPVAVNNTKPNTAAPATTNTTVNTPAKPGPIVGNPQPGNASVPPENSGNQPRGEQASADTQMPDERSSSPTTANRGGERVDSIKCLF